MDEQIEGLIESMEERNIESVEKVSGMIEHQVIGGGLQLTYWNSSNYEEVDHNEVLDLIIEELEEDNFISDGSVSSDMNEIMFEIMEIF